MKSHVPGCGGGIPTRTERRPLTGPRGHAGPTKFLQPSDEDEIQRRAAALQDRTMVTFKRRTGSPMTSSRAIRSLVKVNVRENLPARSKDHPDRAIDKRRLHESHSLRQRHELSFPHRGALHYSLRSGLRCRRVDAYERVGVEHGQAMKMRMVEALRKG